MRADIFHTFLIWPNEVISMWNSNTSDTKEKQVNIYWQLHSAKSATPRYND